MVGGLFPTPGLRRYYGDTAFDPVYREAQALGVMLAVHGAARRCGAGDLRRPGEEACSCQAQAGCYRHPATPLGLRLVKLLTLARPQTQGPARRDPGSACTGKAVTG